MLPDIRFYDFNFNLLYILPKYISFNITIEYNNNGDIELEFFDNDLKKIIEANRNNIMIVCGDLQGFITSYIWTNSKHRVIGMTLNGLLHRAVVQQINDLSGTVADVVYSIVGSPSLTGITWLTLEDKPTMTKKIEYSVDKQGYADEIVQEICEQDNAGYKIFADIHNKQFVFSVLTAKEKQLIISENTLTAYDIECTYNNKDMAFGGWFEKELPDGTKEKQLIISENTLTAYDIECTYNNKDMAFGGWFEKELPDGTKDKTYITLDDALTGLNKIDVILSATTQSAAIAELKKKKAETSIALTAYNISYGVDYELGNIVMFQDGKISNKKIITAITISNEKEYKEDPTFEDYTEEASK
jgi:hypothetical protein